MQQPHSQRNDEEAKTNLGIGSPILYGPGDRGIEISSQQQNHPSRVIHFAKISLKLGNLMINE